MQQKKGNQINASSLNRCWTCMERNAIKMRICASLICTKHVVLRILRKYRKNVYRRMKGDKNNEKLDLSTIWILRMLSLISCINLLSILIELYILCLKAIEMISYTVQVTLLRKLQNNNRIIPTNSVSNLMKFMCHRSLLCLSSSFFIVFLVECKVHIWKSF